MLFEFIGIEVSRRATKGVLDGVLRTIHQFLADERAFNFAREELRERYEQLVQPASYEAITTNLKLSKDDFISFFKDQHPEGNLRAHLHQVLLIRSESWIYNRPNQVIFDGMVWDFLDAYERYFETADPHLLTLGIKETSREILTIVSEIRANLQASAAAVTPDKPSPLSPSLPTELKAFLTVLNIPFEVSEETERSIEIIVVDPSSVFPSKFLLTARLTTVSPDDVDRAVALAAQIDNVSNNLLVFREEPPRDVRAYAERRRVVLQTFEEFSTAFIRHAPRERFTLGSLAVAALAKGLNVGDVYIPPDAVPAQPGETMEQVFFQTRVPAEHLVDSFLNDPASGVLFLLGSYGSGKSAFCAHLMRTLNENGYGPVYFALNQLESADTIPQVVTKAEQLARTTFSKAGSSVVVLDGLDELPNAMNPDEKKRNMLRILEASARTRKLIITVRTSYFRGLADFWHLFHRDEDNDLWHQMAQFLAVDGQRPRVSAMILREFSSDQIRLFVRKFAQRFQMPPGFDDEFMRQIGSEGSGFNYMMLARNPLYLFLLVQSRPWQSTAIGCLADIFAHFVRYWLERDIAKGSSRWRISTEDRLDFMRLFAWHLFQHRRHAATFEEFDNCVQRFLGGGTKVADLRAMALDLQTTGVFNSVGDRISFFTPGFLDYFVATVWAETAYLQAGTRYAWPARLPSIDQAQMWAGHAETHAVPLKIKASEVLERLKIPWSAIFEEPLDWDPRGIIYPEPKSGWHWPMLNHPPQKASKGGELADVRYVLNAVQQTVSSAGDMAIRIGIRNWRGLHAREAAHWTSTCEQWLRDFRGREKPVLTVRKEDDTHTVSMESIMGLMMLGAAVNDVVVIEYSNCSRGEIEALLLNMGCTPNPDAPGTWLGEFCA